MGIEFIIWGILLIIIFVVWWIFESGVVFEAMEDYYKEKDKNNSLLDRFKKK